MPSSDTDWTKIAYEYGNTQLDILIEHFGHEKRSKRFRSMTDQEFLSRIEPAHVRPEWSVFKEVLFTAKKKNLSNEETYSSLLGKYSSLLKDDTLPFIKYLCCIYLCLCLSTLWCERGFSLMNSIKVKSRNRMNTDTLDDRMMICSNGPPVSAEIAKEIDEILDLTFDHWCLVRTRIPSRSHPGISRPRDTGGVEEDVHNMLSAQDKAEVDAHLHVNADNTGAGQRQESDDIGSDDDEAQRDEVPSVDLHETMPVEQDLIDAVSPFIPPPKWVMSHPASRDALQAFQWTGKRLVTKFTEALRRSHICWTWKIMESPRNG
jgi:hypothetical protein